MKFFEGKQNPNDWGNHYNWIDENNVFVGFDADHG
jgi:hypothetical protein